MTTRLTPTQLQPALDSVQSLAHAAVAKVQSAGTRGKTVYVPVYATLPADLLTPVTAYLKVAEAADYSFLLESVHGGEQIGRYSFIGANPYEILVTGEGKAFRVHGDPLLPLERELAAVEFVPVPGLPSFTGGAVGFVAFDCIQYFEPRTRRELKDTLGLPESVFLFCDSLVVFDHLHHVIKVVTHIQVPVDSVAPADVDAHVSLRYAEATHRLAQLLATLSADHVPVPAQAPIPPRAERPTAESNVGKDGYMGFVRTLQHHIVDGDIFQAVPSQRMRLPTKLHPFNAYRQLRSFNPSPYMFYLDLKDFSIVGASPEMLAKVDGRKVYTHPIAGTRKRGKTPDEDNALAADLLGDPKERAEHIMLVDLGRNDVNRICDPSSVKVESLMHIERYSHVMHIVSVVSGELRPEQTPFTAFRSIFPAGTVSGSPKVKAIELIRTLEGEKRGVYAGAVGHFDFSGGMDTCIAIRTMVFKDGNAYLQAGGGIVYDSNQEDEYVETINKMMSSVAALERAEEYYYQLQLQEPPVPAGGAVVPQATKPRAPAPVLKTYADGELPTLRSANAIYQLPQADPTKPVTLLIDNYDSFVFNVYQYLCEEGAQVVVYRNDQITLAEIAKLQLRNIVISPGPGHPADSGVSCDVIRAYAGKVPILGVCLGEQAMFHVYGGTVTHAGAVVHGKTSPIKHDGKGLYRGLPQQFSVTRYHSLAGDEKTAPACLEITSWTADGHVMGVRHREFTVEGVQYHPESVMSEHGHAMVRNFLALRGGRWADNDASFTAGVAETATNGSASPKKPAAAGSETILEKIYRQRRLDVAAAMEVPGRSLSQLRALVAAGAAPAPVDVYARLTRAGAPVPAVMAEVKRASPSKGIIDGAANAGLRALEYARAGAAVISVLTEPTWFKGSLDDLREVHGVLAANFGADRPAVLRKDFVFSEYQVVEARVAGADAVLLIVAMLTDGELHALLAATRALGMEALVEVNNAPEMRRALDSGARIVGVNNRNLHTFDVDMNTTTSVAGMVPDGVVLCALSGIAGRSDVVPYLGAGVHAVLVGEHLMRAADRAKLMRGLWGLEAESTAADAVPEAMEIDDQKDATAPLVKICGLRDPRHAVTAAEAGADLLGFILVPGTRRYVTPEQVRDMVRAVHAAASGNADALAQSAVYGDHRITSAADLAALRARLGRPLTVGVFQDAPLAEIVAAVRTAGLDVVQLHGSEDPAVARYLPVPAIKVFRPTDAPAALRGGDHAVALLDSAKGGSGEAFDWNTVVPRLVGEVGSADLVPFVLAGGLHCGNVRAAIDAARPFAVDVSSGVEVEGVKSDELIRRFVALAKGRAD
ncbi:anthranilate synthase / indole-3-glycerol phosphate synthase [Blastocladiella emersonii ATCC 22665]|nr:anthranilate synthase / indole-3-glycerol phosphate synthase [Blastocladiella emersonii ATCC 22665]